MRSSGCAAAASATEGFRISARRRSSGSDAPQNPEWKTLESKNLVPSARILDGQNRYIDDQPSDYGPNGYMTLEFDGEDLFEIVHMPDGTQVWNQPIEKLDT